MTDEYDVTLDIDVDQLANEITKNSNELMALTSKQVNLRYSILIYRLIKRGKVEVQDLADCAGTVRQNIYRIVDDFEKFVIRQRESKKEGGESL